MSEDESTFLYDIVVPETTAKIILTKEDIVAAVKKRLGRILTAEEESTVWTKIKTTDNWYDIFPRYAEESGIHVYGASELYHEVFQEGVEKAIQNTIYDDFANLWDNLLERALDEVTEGLDEEEEAEEEGEVEASEELTWTNIESQTQTRIQDENVKNGLARCANEKKQRSIDKWRRHYVETKILGADMSVPSGTTKEELIEHTLAFLAKKGAAAHSSPV